MFIRLQDALINLDLVFTIRKVTLAVECSLKIANGSKEMVIMTGDEESVDRAMQFICDAMTEQGLLPETDTIQPCEFSEAAEYMLRCLHQEGFSWIARDRDGKLFAFQEKPKQVGAYWETAFGKMEHIKDPAGDEIDATDNPLNIMSALLGP